MFVKVILKSEFLQANMWRILIHTSSSNFPEKDEQKNTSTAIHHV